MLNAFQKKKKENKIILLKNTSLWMTIIFLPWADSYNSENNDLHIICLNTKIKSHTKWSYLAIYTGTRYNKCLSNVWLICDIMVTFGKLSQSCSNLATYVKVAIKKNTLQSGLLWVLETIRFSIWYIVST